MIKALDDVSAFLIPQIITGEDNKMFHLEWDNQNKTATNIQGQNVVKSADGIMTQEVKHVYDSTQDQTLSFKAVICWRLFTFIIELDPNFLKGLYLLHLPQTM